MNSLQKIGSLILGGIVAIALFGRQKLSFGIKEVQLGGIITTQIIPLRLVSWISNSTIASVLVRSLSGVLVCNGQPVASISQIINKRIASNSYVEQYIYVNIHNQQAISALFENVQSGNVNNLAFELIGDVTIGEQWPIKLRFNRVFTWSDIQQML